MAVLGRQSEKGPTRPWARINLSEVERVLGGVSEALGGGLVGAANGEEPITPDVLRRLLEGYRYVDELLAGRTDIFAYGQSSHILELNHRVLCGISPERRRHYADHLAETERRFYDDREGGIGELHDWYERNRNRPARHLAAGLFVQAVSTPQLFIEGNRRTAVLVASYVLARGGLPPLAVRAEEYPRFDAMSERVLAIDRTGFASGIALTLATHRVADFLLEAGDARLLRAPETLPAGS
jgi:hypothetical protein